ncbi:hypothetical protein PG988_005579 [Apiospora saccharicola]
MAPTIQSHILIDKISTLGVLSSPSIVKTLTQFVEKEPLVKLHASTDASGEDNITNVTTLLDNHSISQSALSPLGVIWITDGEVQMNKTEQLKHIIFKAMTRIITRDMALGSTKKPAEKSYRPFGISFVRIGGNEEAGTVFRHLDDNLRHEFEEYLDTASTEVKGRYLAEDDKEKYYAQCLDIVDYVELKRDEDAEVKAQKIIFGALDPDLDQKE